MYKITNADDTRETAPVLQSAVCLPRTSALPLKLRGIGTSRWQLCNDATSFQGRAEGVQGHVGHIATDAIARTLRPLSRPQLSRDRASLVALLCNIDASE